MIRKRSGPYVTVPVTQLGNAQPSVMYPAWDKYDAATPLDYPAGATVLDPLVGWEDQYPALFVTWWFGSTNLKSDTMDQMKIWSPGDQGTVEVDPADVNVFRDPISGFVYAARSYGTEKINTATPYTVQQTIGARMLQYAQLLADQAYGLGGRTATTDGFYGKTVYQYSNVNSPADPTAAAKLAGYISNLDTARKIAKWITY